MAKKEKVDLTKEEKERLGKIVQLAKLGKGGEKENAIRIIKSLCQKHGLDFDAVMNDDNVEEYFIEYKGDEEHDLLIQVICRYGHMNLDSKIFGNRAKTRLFFKTTKEKYIETLNAWDVLRKLFKKEKRNMFLALKHGFLVAHNLYYQPTPEEWKKIQRRKKKKQEEETEEEKRARAVGNKIAEDLEKANIQKLLE